ncbi:acyltransferase [Mesorhizobium sp. B2-3-5]|uniref:acyltransferase family protein n=1 Tax=Mesorhizobium sp. B2-3-5 TaxID=2589958 RepID=UPI0015E48C44|nr:acyltransferase [Mesorhizobium sp. B2-3-5]
MNVEVAGKQTQTTARIELPGLLAMRCYAALAIVLVHLIALPKLPLPAYLNFIPMNFGYGVPLFYIVSAFGLFVGYAGGLGSRLELRDYYVRRFRRIAPLFYFVMLFYIPFCWLMWGTTIPLSQFISSGLFIFNLIPQHVTGFVAASWSIGVEMAFYAVLPVLVFAVTGVTRALLFFAVAVFVSINWTLAFHGAPELTQFAQSSIVAHMFNFAAGIVGYYVWLILRRRSPVTGALLLGAGLLAIICLICFPALFGALGPGVRTVWAAALAAAVVGVSVHPVRWFVNPAAKLLGNASFSLYLWHPVIITIFDRWGVYRAIYTVRSEGLVPFLVSLLATLAVLVPLALASYRYIERPGMRWGAAERARPVPTGSPAKAH